MKGRTRDKEVGELEKAEGEEEEERWKTRETEERRKEQKRKEKKKDEEIRAFRRGEQAQKTVLDSCLLSVKSQHALPDSGGSG